MKYKQWIAMILACLMLLSGCGDSAKPEKPESPAPPATEAPEPPPAETPEQTEPEDEVLRQLRQDISDSGALFGVAYLGYAELPDWHDVAVYVEANGFGEVFPFLLSVMEDHAVLQEGGEVYAVVPAGEDIELIVSEYLMDESNDYIPDRGADLLRVKDGQPLLLRGNVSEIVPNILITAQSKDGIIVECSPCLSGMDGSLVVDESVYDFTPYYMFAGSEVPYDPEPAFTYNPWYGQHYDADGNLMATNLMLTPNGRAEYSYGWPYSGVVERFEGTWFTEGARLKLALTGGPVDDMGEPVGEQYEMESAFSWSNDGSALLLFHEGGSPLLYGGEGDGYRFMPFDGFHVVNTWTNYSDYWNWYYELTLSDNCQCVFTVGDIGGEALVQYSGSWWLADSRLWLSVTRDWGEHPESPELDHIYGEYLIEDWQPDSMKLVYGNGHILSVEMEAEGYAGFETG